MQVAGAQVVSSRPHQSTHKIQQSEANSIHSVILPVAIFEESILDTAQQILIATASCNRVVSVVSEPIAKILDERTLSIEERVQKCRTTLLRVLCPERTGFHRAAQYWVEMLDRTASTVG